jgi:multiple antibiotic resistance protein
MDVWNTGIGSFLLAFSALLSIVNPVAGALIYNEVTAGQTHPERAALARKIAVYSSIVMLSALWIGASVINFFGISLAALRIAGGLVVAVRAWEMLSAPQESEDRKQEQAAPVRAVSNEDVAFFPLTLPFTTGPGTIAVAIALSSSRPAATNALASFYAGISAAALAVAICVAIAYTFADRIVEFLGPARSRILTRLAAFLLLCIGTQILLTGIDDAIAGMLQHHSANGGEALRVGATSLKAIPNQ